ncbi:MAG: energy transducer TonB [Rhodospirillales bacterium]
MTIRRKHWLAAFLFALLAHGSLVLMLWKPAESGAANLGVGGMDISFGMAGGAPGAEEVSAPETKTVEPVETKTETPPETIPDTPVETVEVAEPLEIEAVEPPTAKTVPVAEVKPKTETAKLPKKIEPPKPPKPVEAKPAPAPQPPKEIATREPEPAKPERKASVAGSAGKSGTQQSTNVGNAASTSSGGRPGSSNSYFALLQAWLEKHKEYPASARQRRNEGTAILSFTLSRDGTVKAASVVQSSGSALLDREVMAMIRRANPLPPFPDDFSEQQITLSVPVQFQLR